MVLKTTTTSLASWLAQTRQSLENHTKTPLLEAQVLAAATLGKTREWVVTHSNLILTPQNKAALDHAQVELLSGVPLAYITGFQEFFGMPFKVTSDVLIPRPETELLVEEALQWLCNHPAAHGALDIGTGSGCIAVALAKHSPHLEIIATDRYRNALQIAQENIRLHALEDRISLLQADLLQGITGRFDLLVTNPPYIPKYSIPTLEVSGHEPWTALIGGEDGLQYIRQIMNQAPSVLIPGGLFLMEIEQSLAGAVLEIARQSFPNANSQILLDLAGFPRLLKINL